MGFLLSNALAQFYSPGLCAWGGGQGGCSFKVSRVYGTAPGLGKVVPGSSEGQGCSEGSLFPPAEDFRASAPEKQQQQQQLPGQGQPEIIYWGEGPEEADDGYE